MKPSILAFGLAAALTTSSVMAQQKKTVITPPVTQARDGGTNVGGGGGSSDLVIEWCRGSTALLKQYRERAILADLMQDSIGRRDLLIMGLQKALERKQDQGMDQSLTYKAIWRGLELATALEITTDGSCQPAVDLETQYIFLSRYYDFIEYVATKVDIDLFIPYTFNFGANCPSGQCDGFDIQGFEERYVEYAREQLKWFVEVFVTNTDEMGVTPRHSETAYLKVLEFVAKYVADDLNGSLWRAKYACTIDTMRLLNETLAAHNAGNPIFYRTDRYAVNMTYKDVSETISTIQTACGTQKPVKK